VNTLAEEFRSKRAMSEPEWLAAVKKLLAEQSAQVETTFGETTLRYALFEDGSILYEDGTVGDSTPYGKLSERAKAKMSSDIDAQLDAEDRRIARAIAQRNYGN